MERTRLPTFDATFVANRVAEREQTEQFQSLPAHIQDEYRERWQGEIECQLAREQGSKRLWKVAVVDGVATFLLWRLVFDVVTVPSLAIALVVGAATGLLWRWSHAGRFRSIFLALPGYFVCRAFTPMPNVIFLLFGGLAFLTFCAIAGTMRELRD